MKREHCCHPKCKREVVITVLGKQMCQKHWDKHCEEGK